MNGNGTAREYAALSHDYERRWRRYLAATHEHTLEALAPRAGERVLDVGCGTGLFLSRLTMLEPSLRLAGCDPTPGMLGEARARLPSATVLTHAALPRLPFPDAAFDAVTLVSVLHHLTDTAASLAEMARVLKPGGRLVITDWNGDAWHMRLFACWLTFKRPAAIHLERHATFEPLLAAAGLPVHAYTRWHVSPLWSLVTLQARKQAAGER